MTVEISKKATKAQVKKALEKFETERQKKRTGKGNIAHLFGANPEETDGMVFQKKVRKEWD